MRRALFLSLSLALASGLDFSVGVREESGRQFLSSVGLSVNAHSLWFRLGVRFGAPNGVLAEGSVAYLLPTPMLKLYGGGGYALGLTERDSDGGYRFAVGEVQQPFLLVGLALPDRGYRPYLEAAYYLGENAFVRYCVGFVMEVF